MGRTIQEQEEVRRNRGDQRTERRSGAHPIARGQAVARCAVLHAEGLEFLKAPSASGDNEKAAARIACEPSLARRIRTPAMEDRQKRIAVYRFGAGLGLHGDRITPRKRSSSVSAYIPPLASHSAKLRQ